MKEDKRITIRFNEKEQAELELLKASFHLDKDSEAIKSAIEWVNHYIKNVTINYFPPSYDVVLMKKKKTEQLTRRVF